MCHCEYYQYTWSWQSYCHAVYEKLGLEYRFCSEFLQGKIASKEDLFEGLFIAIRQFAKRQETWFRHQMDSHFYTVDLDNIENTINQIIKDVDGWLK